MSELLEKISTDEESILDGSLLTKVERDPPKSFSSNGHLIRRRIALVGTFPPTNCGLATFTSNLLDAIATSRPQWRAEVLRVVDGQESIPSPNVVGHWLPGDSGTLRMAIETLNTYEAVLLQHEYGLYGDQDGVQVLDLVDGLTVPLIAVLHTVLTSPSPGQRAILERIVRSAAVVVVQSAVALQRLHMVHGAENVIVIPHGAAQNFFGPVMLDIPKPAVLTWGLLSPGKGIEDGIAAISKMEAKPTAATYIVAGRTHPKERAVNGERHRRRLKALARSLGVEGRVRFDDVYRSWDSLRALIRSADVVLLPYESREQVSSGVLVEAVASGKPVVSTRFPHAEELLSNGAGILVEQGDSRGMAGALDRVLHEPGVADHMAAAARRSARPLLWPKVGVAYANLVEHVVNELAAA